MNLMITGACGHIGSYLSKKFIKYKNIKKIVLIDNLHFTKINPLFNLKSKKITFVDIDLSKKKSLNKINDIDFVIHCASLTNAENSFKIKKLMYKNNLSCMKNVIAFCIKNNAKLIHLSSTSVYGSQKDRVYEDNDEFINPQSPYAKIKVIEENMLRNNKLINYVSFRLGTIAGVSPGMRFHTAVNKFCLDASLKRPIKVYKTAFNQSRPYLSLKDAFNAFKFFLFNGKIKNLTYNLLSDNCTVKQIISIIKKYKKNIKIKFVKAKIMNQLSYNVENSKLKKTGFKINNYLKKDIKETLLYLNNYEVQNNK